MIVLRSADQELMAATWAVCDLLEVQRGGPVDLARMATVLQGEPEAVQTRLQREDVLLLGLGAALMLGFLDSGRVVHRLRGADHSAGRRQEALDLLERVAAWRGQTQEELEDFKARAAAWCTELLDRRDALEVAECTATTARA